MFFNIIVLHLDVIRNETHIQNNISVLTWGRSIVPTTGNLLPYLVTCAAVTCFSTCSSSSTTKGLANDGWASSVG